MENRQFPCEQCGADLKFEPGVSALQCPYCGHVNTIEVTADPVEELDYQGHLSNARAETELYEVMTVKCPRCGAETTFDPNVAADECAFCGTSLIKTAHAERLIKPQAQLPFKVTKQEAVTAFQKWINGLWFAPNALKKYRRREGGIQGVYLPHWTYDTHTSTTYHGQRGEYYWVTESYTAMENGKAVRRTRQVRKTRWYPASGRVRNTFDDVLVAASTSLPRKYVHALEPWDLHALLPYDDAFQSGFRTESYSINLEEGFEIAKGRMEPTIHATICGDIGGDEQRVLTKQTTYRDITFKHILLPLWISAYRYQDKVFRFMVNARTGEVQGERPWSWVKITLLILAIALVIVAFILLKQQGAA